MSKLKIFAGVAMLMLAVTLGWAGLASAHSFRTGSTVNVGSNQTINETLFAAGRTIDINSEVNGDIFCAGQTVNISGTVNGDVICAGQTVNITGKVNGDVRLAGQTVSINSEVTGNATIGGQTMNLSSAGKIGGDLTLGTTDATLNGPVGRDIAAGGNSLTISSDIGRNVTARLNQLTLANGAHIKGNVEVTSTSDVQKESGATVDGKTTHNLPSPSKPSSKATHALLFGFGFVWFLYWFLAMLFTAMALVLLFPRLFQITTDRAMPRPWKALLTGFLASLALPFVLLLLAFTVIGIPLALFFGLLWIVTLIMSGPVFGYYLGRLILRDSRQPLLIMLVGAVVLLILYFIPIIGLITIAAAVWTGSGMLLLEAFSRTPKPVYTIANSNSKPGRPKSKS